MGLDCLDTQTGAARLAGRQHTGHGRWRVGRLHVSPVSLFLLPIWFELFVRQRAPWRRWHEMDSRRRRNRPLHLSFVLEEAESFALAAASLFNRAGWTSPFLALFLGLGGGVVQSFLRRFGGEGGLHGFPAGGARRKPAARGRHEGRPRPVAAAPDRAPSPPPRPWGLVRRRRLSPSRPPRGRPCRSRERAPKKMAAPRGRRPGPCPVPTSQPPRPRGLVRGRRRSPFRPGSSRAGPVAGPSASPPPRRSSTPRARERRGNMAAPRGWWSGSHPVSPFPPPRRWGIIRGRRATGPGARPPPRRPSTAGASTSACDDGGVVAVAVKVGMVRGGEQGGRGKLLQVGGSSFICVVLIWNCVVLGQGCMCF